MDGKNENSIWLFRLVYDRLPLAFPQFGFAIYYGGIMKPTLCILMISGFHCVLRSQYDGKVAKIGGMWESVYAPGRWKSFASIFKFSPLVPFNVLFIILKGS